MIDVDEVHTALCSAWTVGNTADVKLWHDDDMSWLHVFANLKDLLKNVVVYKAGTPCRAAGGGIFRMDPASPRPVAVGRCFAADGWAMGRPEPAAAVGRKLEGAKIAAKLGDCMQLHGCSSSTAPPHGCSMELVALDSSYCSDTSGLSGAFSPAAPAGANALLATPAPPELSFGAHTRTGIKLNFPDWQNQDRFLVLPLGPLRALAAVFDGHGQWGHLVAARVREVFATHAPTLVPQAPGPLSDEAARAALLGLFALADEVLYREVDERGRPLAEFSGTTATAALLDAQAGRVAVAHVGDSALMVTAGETIFFRTVDHTVDAAAERRVIAAGGEVQQFTISGITARRVCMRGSQYPGLAMSRALGDLVAQDLGVLAEPEVRVGVPFPPGSLLVVATDGVWETVPAEDAAHCAAGLAADPQLAARALVEMARARWQQGGNIDDITAVAVAAPLAHGP